MENNVVLLSNEQLETVTGGDGGSASGLTFRGVTLGEDVMNTTIEAFCMGCGISITLQEMECYASVSDMTLQQFCTAFGEAYAQELLNSH